MKTNTTIEWVDIKPLRRGKNNSTTIRMHYHSSKGKKKNPYCMVSFPGLIRKDELDKTFCRFGKLSGKVIIKFNNESGVKLSKSVHSNNSKDLKVYGKGVCEFVLNSMSCQLFEGNYDLSFSKIADNTYIIDSLKYDV